jgi:membrane protease YdiL (CAAX protease family)
LLAAVAGLALWSVLLAFLSGRLTVPGNLWVGGLALPLGGTGVAVVVLGWGRWHGLKARLELVGAPRGAARVPLVAVTVGVGAYLAAIPSVWLSVLVLRPFGFVPQPSPLIDVLSSHPSMGVWLSVLALALVIAPLAEEILFRLVMVEALRTVDLPRPALLSALVFAAIHNHPEQLLGLCVLALWLYRLRERYDSLRPAILAHTVFNVLALLGAIRQMAQT